MSITRTARRRRRQYAMGVRGLAVVFGHRHAPEYRKKSVSKSAKQLAKQLAKLKAMQQRKGMKK